MTSLLIFAVFVFVLSLLFVSPWEFTYVVIPSLLIFVFFGILTIQACADGSCKADCAVVKK